MAHDKQAPTFRSPLIVSESSCISASLYPSSLSPNYSGQTNAVEPAASATDVATEFTGLAAGAMICYMSACHQGSWMLLAAMEPHHAFTALNFESKDSSLLQLAFIKCLMFAGYGNRIPQKAGPVQSRYKSGLYTYSPGRLQTGLQVSVNGYIIKVMPGVPPTPPLQVFLHSRYIDLFATV